MPLGSFQFDDFDNVVRDPATVDGSELLVRLLRGVRPLTRLSFFAEATLFGVHPAGFLATNLLLHLLTVLLVHALARSRLAEERAAFTAAAAFALQPAHAETVAYVSGRSTGLMSCLLLAGLLLHQRGRRWLALSLFAASCLAKEVALVFPLLVLVWSGRKALLLHLGLAALFAGGLLLSPRYRELAEYSLSLRPPLTNLLAAGRAVPLSVSLWARPWALSADHAFDPDAHRALGAAGLALLLGLGGLAIGERRRFPLAALAVLWSLLALLPTHSLLAKIDLVTEKPLYLAWLGPSLLLGRGAALLIETSKPRLAASLAALLLASGGWWSVWRASLWRDPLLLWLDATAKAPLSSRCWDNLGMSWLDQERYPEAAGAFRQALRLDPSNEVAAENLRATEDLCKPPCGPLPPGKQ